MRLWLAAGLVLTLGLAACDQNDPIAQARARCGNENAATAERIAACTTWLDTADLADADRAEALALRGRAHQDASSPTEALRDYNAALLIEPRSDAQLGKALILFESGQLDAAQPLVDAVITRGDADARARWLRGRLRARYGDATGAIEDYDAAIAGMPRFAEALTDRGRVKQSTEDFAGARADFDAAIRLDPNDARSRAGRCWNRLYQNEDAGAARDDGRAAANADPQFISGQLCLGMAALKLEDWPTARDAYEAAAALEPSNAEAIYGRGFARVRTGARREGNDDIDQAQRFDSRVENDFLRVGVRL